MYYILADPTFLSHDSSLSFSDGVLTLRTHLVLRYLDFLHSLCDLHKNVQYFFTSKKSCLCCTTQLERSPSMAQHKYSRLQDATVAVLSVASSSSHVRTSTLRSHFWLVFCIMTDHAFIYSCSVMAF